jgi:hypothetical protein
VRWQIAINSATVPTAAKRHESYLLDRVAYMNGENDDYAVGESFDPIRAEIVEALLSENTALS